MRTSHGHHIPGTRDESNEGPPIANCGGIASCLICATEAEQAKEEKK